MKFPLIHKKPSLSHKRMLLTDPNSLIGYRIDDGHIKLMSVLGVGGNGVVYHAVECCHADMPHPSEPREFAIKAISKVGLDPRQLRLIEREFELHTRVCDHPHVVTFHGIVEEEDFYFVVLDYLPDGDIFDMIDVRRAYMGNDELIKSVFLQLIDALEHCHSLGVSHRDLKPENILCKNNGSHILLADFGLGTDRKVVREYGFGSEPYMAPQCFGGFWQKLGPYSAPKADIWSLGVVFINIACTRNPWHKATDESDIYKRFLNTPDYLLQILPISHAFNDILKRMFAINPHARISLKDLRRRVQAVQRFTMTAEELKWASPAVKNAVNGVNQTQRRPALTPGAPHTVVARQITNLTAEDIERLESEARAEAREAALLTELEAQACRSTCLAFDEDEDDVVGSPLFLSPDISPSTTLFAQDSTPRPHRPVSFHAAFSVAPDSDPDSDSDSNSDSDGPITPESRPAADTDIAGVPEISLDGDCASDIPSLAGPAVKHNRHGIPEATRTAVRKVWWL